MTNKIKNKRINNETIRKAGSLLISFGLMFLAFFFIPPNTPTVKEQAIKQAESKQEARKEAFARQIDVEAKAFVVYDIESGQILFSKDEKTILPLASLTKIMTALTASDLAKNDTMVNIGDSKEKNTGIITPKEKWGLEKLINLTLVSSSNFGAESIASVIGASTQTNFIGAMNQKAKILGLEGMSFTNETGLDINNAISGANGSALDVAKLFTYVLKNKPGIFEATKFKVITETSLDNKNHTAINTNEIINKIPGLIASKTGFTNMAGGNLAIIANLGLRHPIAFVVMGSSEKGRFADTEKLVQVTEEYLSAN